MATGSRWWAALLGAVALVGPAAAQEEDPEALLADAAVPDGTLRERLTALAPSLSASNLAYTSPGLVTWSAGDENDRKIFHRVATEFHNRCREALASLGFSPPEAGALHLAVRVTSARSVPRALLSADGSAILVRDPPPASAAARPAPPERYDGPPMLRDVLSGAALGRRWLAQERSRVRSRGPGTLGAACARSLVAALKLPESTPPWIREGLAAWVEARALGVEAPPAHLAAAFAPGASGSPWKGILAPGGEVPDGALPVLGLALEGLLEGKTDVPGRLARLAGGAAPSSPEVFGADPLQAILSASSRAAPKEESCRLDGTVLCPLCRGSARFTIACTECEGSGAIACPACGASDICPAPKCVSGLFLIDEDSGYDCKLCRGYAFVFCFACKDPALKCAVCKGQKKISWTCPLCVRGRLPCPGCPRPEADPCPTCRGERTLPCDACADGKAPWSCEACGGAGYRGCALCYGMCRTCDERNTSSYCTACKDGKTPCTACKGKGAGRLAPDRCPAHPGAPPRRPCPACAPPEAEAVPGASEGAPAATLDAALAFLLATRDSSGAFSPRSDGTLQAAGGIRKHNLFTNAVTLWTLFTAGRTRTEEPLAGAWKVLCAEAEQAAAANATEVGTQEAAFALRALLVAGIDPKAKVVQGLVNRLVRAQRPDGLWADDIKTREVSGGVLNALIVLEALRVAKDRGLSVPSETWSRAHDAAGRLFSSRTVKAKRGDLLHGTEVACCVSLIVLSKAGSLGAKAGTYDYRSMPDVKAGLAWLDRHFDVAGKPTYLNGARVHRRNLEGYYAYMYSMQRLAMLLGISEFNGHRWFPEGAAHLAKVQRKDGSFEEVGYGGLNGSAVSTTFAVLFLVRATTPITDPTSR